MTNELIFQQRKKDMEKFMRKHYNHIDDFNELPLVKDIRREAMEVVFNDVQPLIKDTIFNQIRFQKLKQKHLGDKKKPA